MLSSSPSSKMHLIVPSGNLIRVENSKYLHDFLCSVRKVLFNLIVCKLKYLQPVLKGGLRCLCFRKIVSHFLVWECLFDVLIVKVNDCVTIGERLSFNSVIEDHFFLSTSVNSLDLAVVANDLFDHFRVSRRFSVVLLWELQTIIFVLVNFALSSHIQALSNISSLLTCILFFIIFLVPHFFLKVFSFLFKHLLRLITTILVLNLNCKVIFLIASLVLLLLFLIKRVSCICNPWDLRRLLSNMRTRICNVTGNSARSFLLLHNNPLLLHRPKIFAKLLVLLLEIIVQLGQPFNLNFHFRMLKF